MSRLKITDKIFNDNILLLLITRVVKLREYVTLEDKKNLYKDLDNTKEFLINKYGNVHNQLIAVYKNCYDIYVLGIPVTHVKFLSKGFIDFIGECLKDREELLIRQIERRCAKKYRRTFSQSFLSSIISFLKTKEVCEKEDAVVSNNHGKDNITPCADIHLKNTHKVITPSEKKEAQDLSIKVLAVLDGKDARISLRALSLSCASIVVTRLYNDTLSLRITYGLFIYQLVKDIEFYKSNQK